MDRPKATPTPLVEDARTRVTRWDFAPGAETGWHVHDMDYVVTTLTPCSFLLEEPGGTARRVELAAGVAYTRPKGIEHNVVNGGSAPMAFVEIELK